jgi:hypothetical protein
MTYPEHAQVLLLLLRVVAVCGWVGTLWIASCLQQTTLTPAAIAVRVFMLSRRLACLMVEKTFLFKNFY